MKVSQETYESLKADMASVVKAMGINLLMAPSGETGLATMWSLLHKVSRDRAYSDEHPGFASRAWIRILPHDGRDACFYYENGCNDAHVATALRRIKAELITELK